MSWLPLCCTWPVAVATSDCHSIRVMLEQRSTPETLYLDYVFTCTKGQEVLPTFTLHHAAPCLYSPGAKASSRWVCTTPTTHLTAHAENIPTGRLRLEKFARGSFQVHEGESHRPDKRKKKGRKEKQQQEEPPHQTYTAKTEGRTTETAFSRDSRH